MPPPKSCGLGSAAKEVGKRCTFRAGDAVLSPVGFSAYLPFLALPPCSVNTASTASSATACEGHFYALLLKNSGSRPLYSFYHFANEETGPNSEAA